MTTLKAFDEMMNQFLGELAQTFPDEPTKTAIGCDDFLGQVAPWSQKLTAHDDSFFCEENTFVKNLNLHTIWKSPECSETTKQAIWQYIQSMYMIGTTMKMFPADTLSAIEAAAENCAKNIKKNESGNIDEASLMAGMNSMLSQMMSGGALAGMLPQPPRNRAQPRPGSRKKKGNRK
jgi:hypothetical protein